MERVAIASSLVTLDDLLKTDICKGTGVHCQFNIDDVQVYHLIKEMKKNNMPFIHFRNKKLILSELT